MKQPPIKYGYYFVTDSWENISKTYLRVQRFRSNRKPYLSTYWGSQMDLLEQTNWKQIKTALWHLFRSLKATTLSTQLKLFLCLCASVCVGVCGFVCMCLCARVCAYACACTRLSACSQIGVLGNSAYLLNLNRFDCRKCCPWQNNYTQSCILLCLSV